MLMITPRASFGNPFDRNNSMIPAAAPVSTPSTTIATVMATNTGIVPPGVIVNSSTGQVVPTPIQTGPMPTAAVDDGTILGLAPMSWLLVGGAAYLAWKFFGHHAEKSAAK